MKIIDGTIASPLGFSADGLHAGFKKKKLDFGWIVSEVPASVAGVYTTNKVIAAPLLVTKASIQKSQKLQAIVVNSGIANSCTGQQGLDAAYEMQRLTAQKLKIEPDLVGLASTGVIGEQLPMDALKNGLSQILVSGKAEDFAEAILTTDTCTKTCVVTEEFGSDLVTMAGVAKGSGMIHPNMATMLAFITCDANISSATLQAALSQHVETTFNQITVDGDTSTNDMVLVMANGFQQNEEILPNTEEFEKFSKMLRYLMADLARKIAKDGEGATKLIEVNVRHAKDEQSGRMIAKSVVGSSLVKTAIFGQDPNWGRILAAIGYAGADVSVDNIDIWIEGIPVMQASSPVAFDSEETSDAMAGELLTLTIDLHDGDSEAQAWGCDLSYDYVKINALYRT
ncbi:bifunctional glutamate N-acetyltransferase/amino-acid acetyltransferase ArgJ [Streptococcus gordonii]|jgi:glutamate N-acetyltransferase/amino-acid acetyltransferase|uniref:bifunctional glutamate N-acetyltransferase/amino-acid acetyltransferase ArgJ n=1 Tax=Streptococcus gordonii TaxID=1302 RepID=UPI00073B6EB2|nr:bifunctional glutamate N-acetyltransferase/amino-acid acetyltransferase ArgJ [Streptococcus gordonii]KTF20027.1 ornithine acetyltransferase [Streptococcus gordonii]KXC02562.1 ornithine acetyltransferase [Streptococcus gordonii]MBZ2150803.1 bifunctional glutamate N-acetyltransferase/amino-acid acetyltransferase ArgJ [Streptococcus gordonii]QWZ56863.1 bifunctional glutamate N-acetyltransferase/amino-acid acetyltransferase ArgJ [Streptococcus gordonii]SQF28119.1 bifunctional ornithine acetyltr